MGVNRKRNQGVRMAGRRKLRGMDGQAKYPPILPGFRGNNRPNGHLERGVVYTSMGGLTASTTIRWGLPFPAPYEHNRIVTCL